MAVQIREMRPADMQAVIAIYAAGIQEGGATLTAEAPTLEEWEKAHLPVCRFVALQEGRIAGFIALLPFSARSVYSGVAELSVYVDAAHRGQGVGRALMDALFTAAEQHGFWTLLAKVLAGNETSLRLHKSSGFRMVGVHEKLGRDKNGVWQDIVLLEKRSNKI